MSLPTLMVLDGEEAAPLGIVRSLGRKGVPIIVGSDSSIGRSGFSRYAHRRFSYSVSDKGIAAAHSRIMEKIGAWRPDVLMPVLTRGWSVIYAFYEEYARLTTIVPNPGRELFESISDKSHMVDYAEQYGVQIPMTFRPKTFGDALALCKSLPFPVLLKPRKSTGGRGIRMAKNAGDLTEALMQFREVPLIQERIQGEDLELTILCIHGEPISGSAYVSLRNAPQPFGPPVACRTIQDKTLMRIGMDFLMKLRYHGVAHLDFRRDQRDGQPKLLDFNPRIAGTNDISLCSGIDFAYMQYQVALGGNVASCFECKLGKEYRWLMPEELRHLVMTNNKSQTVRELLRWHNVATEISITDPLPHVAVVATVFQNQFRKLRRQRIST